MIVRNGFRVKRPLEDGKQLRDEHCVFLIKERGLLLKILENPPHKPANKGKGHQSATSASNLERGARNRRVKHTLKILEVSMR